MPTVERLNFFLGNVPFTSSGNIEMDTLYRANFTGACWFAHKCVKNFLVAVWHIPETLVGKITVLVKRLVRNYKESKFS